MWHPKVKGAAYVFDHYLQPMLRSHEANIDRSLGSAKTRTVDYVSGHFQRCGPCLKSGCGWVSISRMVLLTLCPRFHIIQGERVCIKLLLLAP